MDVVSILPWVLAYTACWLVCVGSWFGGRARDFYDGLLLPVFSPPRIIHAFFGTTCFAMQAAACVLVNGRGDPRILGEDDDQWSLGLTFQVVALFGVLVYTHLFFHVHVNNVFLVVLVFVVVLFEALVCWRFYLLDYVPFWLVFFSVFWYFFLANLHFAIWVKNRSYSRNKDVDEER